MRTSRLILLIVALVFVGVRALPASASDVLAFTEGETETEAEEEPTGSELGIEPAVTVPAEAEAETEQPWTQRFLAPTVAVLGLLGLIAAIAYYGIRIRGRYRVVED